MTDRDIVNLYWRRSEQAVEETALKYGNYCQTIAYNILHNTEDAEECVSDTYLSAWNSMSDKRPEKLSPFLGKITRNFALKKVVRSSARKRGGGEAHFALEELDECIASGYDLEREVENRELARAIDSFLSSLPTKEQLAFICRYWYFAGEKEIAQKLGLSRSGVNTMLRRIREKLKSYLIQEGLCTIQNGSFLP